MGSCLFQTTVLMLPVNESDVIALKSGATKYFSSAIDQENQALVLIQGLDVTSVSNRHSRSPADAAET